MNKIIIFFSAIILSTNSTAQNSDTLVDDFSWLEEPIIEYPLDSEEVTIKTIEEINFENASRKLADAESIATSVVGTINELTSEECMEVIDLIESAAEVLGSVDAYDYFLKGYCHYTIGEYQKAIMDFTKCIQLTPDSDRYYFMRKEHLVKMNDDYYTSMASIPLNIRPYEAYKFRGACKQVLQDYRGAIDDFTKALKFEDKIAGLYHNRADCYAQLSNYELAVSDASKAIKLNNQLADAYIIRGLSNYNLGKINEGCLDVSKAGELGFEDAYTLIKEYCK